MNARFAALALVPAMTTSAQPTDLDIDETQSSIFLEITLDTPIGARTDDDTAALDGVVTIELDDYANPTTITLIDYTITSGSLSYTFDYSFLGAINATATGLSLSLPATTPPITGTVDSAGMFTIDNVPNTATGTVNISGSGTVGGLVGNQTLDLSTLAQDPVTITGSLNLTTDTVTATISLPLDGSGTDPDTGVVTTFTGTASVVASGPVPAPDCLADVNGDGMVTPADFSAWINAYNNQLPACDQNGDGSCTPADFSAWINNYNAGC